MNEEEIKKVKEEVGRITIKLMNVLAKNTDLNRQPLGDFPQPLGESQLLTIGKVTAAFVYLESSIKNSLLTRFPEFSKKYLNKAKITPLMELVAEFESSELRSFIKKAADFRNILVHRIYEDVATKADEVEDLHVLAEKITEIPLSLERLSKTDCRLLRFNLYACWKIHI